MKIAETHIVPAISKKIRLQEYAVSIFSSITTRSAVKKAIKKGLILLDHRQGQTSDWIHEGQRIDLLEPDLHRKKVFELKMDVLFEDDFIAVVHKPPGYATSGNFFKTVQNALPFNLKPTLEPDVLPFPLPAHRLDTPTSGILVCAKTKKSLVALHKDFAAKKIQKYYFALVHNKFSVTLEINTPLEGKPAKTIAKPFKYFQLKNGNYSLIEAIPLTGRTHQIRKHLSQKAYPIVGDKEYGIEETGIFRNKLLYLFAGKIKFQHPVHNKAMEFELLLPKRFRNLENLK